MLVVRRLPARPSSSPASPIPARRRRRWPSPVPPPTLVLGAHRPDDAADDHDDEPTTRNLYSFLIVVEKAEDLCTTDGTRQPTPLDPRDCIRSLVDDLGAAVTLVTQNADWLEAAAEFKDVITLPAAQTPSSSALDSASWLLVVSGKLLTVNSSIVREAHERGLPICVLGQPLLSDFDFVLPPRPASLDLRNKRERSEETECTNLLDGPSSKRHHFSNPSDDHDEVDSGCYLDYESATGSSRHNRQAWGSPFAISPSSWGGPTSPELEELTRSSKPAAVSLNDLNSLSDPTTHPIIPPPPLVPAGSPPRIPSLILVGAGPGAPDLLTIRAVNAIQSATLIIADRLVPRTVLLAHVPPSTPILTARKLPGRAPEAQSEIHDWIEAALKLGHVVVRLKGGDPHVFGRGGEEILRVRERWFAMRGDVRPTAASTDPIPLIQSIPGISSALAAPLAAGIPVSHRGVADQILVLTGTRENGSRPTVPLYCPSRTTIVLMGMTGLDGLTKLFVESAGYPPDLPAAVVEKAFCVEDVGPGHDGETPARSVQRVVRGRISDIASKVKELGIKAHATLVVGSVVDVLSEQHVGFVLNKS